MRYIARFFQIIYCLYAFTIFLAVMFILLPFVFIASFFGKIKGGNVIYFLCRVWSYTCLFLWGIRHKNYIDAGFDKGKAYIFVFNHISYIDIPLLLVTFKYQQIRILGKAEMSKIPVFGFIYKNAVVPVARSSAENRAKSLATLKSVLSKDISIVIAPEGTFNMTGEPLKSFYDGAFKVAIDTNTPIKPVIFLDAYRRLHYKSVFSLTPGLSRAIFLEEITPPTGGDDGVACLKEKVYHEMEKALIEHQAPWIKTN